MFFSEIIAGQKIFVQLTIKKIKRLIWIRTEYFSSIKYASSFRTKEEYRSNQQIKQVDCYKLNNWW